jgi:hypothetical protein
MYQVTHTSSGIIAISFMDRADAVYWASVNNVINDEYAKLYVVVKAKQKNG